MLAANTQATGTPPRAFSEVTAVILCGGLGMRLQSISSDRPKVLAQVKRKPFLDRVLEQLASVGGRQVIFCTGHLGDQIERTYGERFAHLELRYSREPSPLGTGGALRLALARCDYETLLVMNGDSYCDVDLENFYRWHQERNASASLVLAHVGDTRRSGRVSRDAEGRVLTFQEKGESRGAGWINAGIYLIQRRLVEILPQHQPLSLEREVFPEWIRSGFFGYDGSERFLDIGTPESYARAEHFFEQTLHSKVSEAA